LDLAEADARDALEITEKLRGRTPSSSRSGLAWLVLARLHERRGDIASARRDARAALPHLQAQLDPRHPALTDAQRLAAPAAGPVQTPAAKRPAQRRRRLVVAALAQSALDGTGPPNSRTGSVPKV